ncbi:MAG: type VI secretion system baseplate subunit TssK [Acidobacteria bacterium]|nr:type VI secretion system baseplate subunit TssK [Acidobacteriota bacterium]
MMKHLSRVVWSEGMYLAPHHFQVQSRYFEDSIQFAAAALCFEPYGFVGFGLDAEALRNGILSLLHARGIFPDGLPFQMPDCDPLPQARNIADLFPPAREKVTVLLSIPERKPGGLNCAQSLGEGGWVRYLAESQSIPDETTGRDEKPVPMGRKNFSLLLDTEVHEGILGLPIAVIMRDGSGHFIFDPEFIPPLTTIAASDRLMNILKRLIEILDDKSAGLSKGSAATARTWAEYSTRDVAQFWLLHTVNSALAPLRDIYSGRNVHPESLFVQMLRLAGALCTFAMESHPRDLPLYNHNDLGGCFAALDHHIRMHLETVVPTNVISIPLQKSASYFYEGDITDQRCLDRARWIFSIRSATGEVEIIGKTPQLVKICSKLFVPKLVERALPGMGMTHLPTPPSSIATKVDAQYFSISRSGPCWDHILQTRQVGIYVPGELPDPELELLIILES